MAAAEARAAWQRTANRCFVQEDAKRAPKLACCQTSSSSKPVDTGQGNPADVFENPAVGFKPVKRSPSSANLPPDLRWWLQMQPNYGSQRGLTDEQLSGLEIETESFRSDGVHSSDKLNVVEPFARVSTTSVKKESEVKNVELKTMYCEVSPELSDMSSYYEVPGIDSDGSSAGKQKVHEFGSGYESPWIGTQRAEPWWRTAGRDELASLVLQKSLDHVDNCDLPPPQNTNLGWNPVGQFGFSSNRVVTSSPNKKCTGAGLANLSIQSQKNLSMTAPYSVQRASVEHSKLSSNSASSNSTIHDDVQDSTQQTSLNDHSKTQLLEALCHSQTRAREAEMAAQQASIEKEHIMKLFFRQASYLFAYKQWFKLLQLETFYFQLKNKDQPLSSLFPAALPAWTPQKARKLKKSWQKRFRGKRFKPGHSRFGWWKYGLGVVLGLGLVGAGLLIGWTVGWLFPPI
ncbi:unnamed protein product [Rhodiola kirilowii]